MMEVAETAILTSTLGEQLTIKNHSCPLIIDDIELQAQHLPVLQYFVL